MGILYHKSTFISTDICKLTFTFVNLSRLYVRDNKLPYGFPFSLITASQIFILETSWQTFPKELQYDNLRWAESEINRPHDLTTISANKMIRSHDAWLHQSGADFTTTCLTTFRIGLLGDSSTRRTLYQFFQTKKHVLDAISHKKLYPFAWGLKDRKFKFCTRAS